MSPQVYQRKRELLIRYLKDFKQFEHVSFNEFMEAHYTIERLSELLISVCSHINLYLITTQKEETPTTYRSTFLRAGELSIIDQELAQRLARAAGIIAIGQKVRAYFMF